MHRINRKCFLVILTLFSLLPCFAHAKLEPMTDKELGETTAMGAVDFSIIGGDTMRFYFDIHAEVYAEIDSIKLGYYQRDDLTTRKFLNPIDPHVVDNKNGTFDLVEDGVTVMDNAPYHIYIDHNNDEHQIPYCDNDFYMYKYTEQFGGLFTFYADGRQGLNDEWFVALIAGEDFSSERSKNTNNMDWDLNIENLRVGESPSNPAVIDGLIIHMKYDGDLNSSSRKLTDIIIGTNSFEGDFFGDFKRVTGYVNGKLSHRTRSPGVQEDLIAQFTEAPVPVSLKRDSFLMLIDHYRAQYNDPNDGDDTISVAPSVPGDPTNNQIHTGMFLRLGLDPESEHYGYSIIAGFNEIVANSYEPSGVMIKDAIANWWKN